MLGDDLQLEYSLFKKDILSELEKDDVFIDLMVANYAFIAERYGCQVTLSKRRLREAKLMWRLDLSRTLNDGIEKDSTELDHFKHAAFLAFWLRRMLPINETNMLSGRERSDRLPLKSSIVHFYRYGNEISALQIGFQLCLYYESEKTFPAGGKVRSIRSDRREYLKQTKFPTDLLLDYSMILKHKSMSPHSLYLMYRSLFCTPNGSSQPHAA